MYTTYEKDKFKPFHEVFIQDRINNINKVRLEILLDNGGEIISATGGETTVIVVRYYVPIAVENSAKEEDK